VPLAARGIAAGLTLGFAKSLGDFGVTLMVAGNIPGETQTASLAIYDAIAASREPEALGMIAVLSTMAVGALFLVNRMVGRQHAC
jgi:molybdate transport system permease protein